MFYRVIQLRISAVQPVLVSLVKIAEMLLYVYYYWCMICAVQESPAINEFKIGGLASYLCKREKRQIECGSEDNLENLAIECQLI